MEPCSGAVPLRSSCVSFENAAGSVKLETALVAEDALAGEFQSQAQKLCIDTRVARRRVWPPRGWLRGPEKGLAELHQFRRDTHTTRVFGVVLVTGPDRVFDSNHRQLQRSP